jgi:hypothetical protein
VFLACVVFSLFVNITVIFQVLQWCNISVVCVIFIHFFRYKILVEDYSNYESVIFHRILYIAVYVDLIGYTHI